MDKGLIEKIIVSDEQFRAQFDKNSSSFHNGNPTVVPLGRY